MKINRLKSLRIGTAVMSTVVIASMSGCVSQSKKFTSQQKRMIEEDTAKMTRLSDIFHLSDEINTYFKENNLDGELKDANGIIYVDYPTNYTNVKDEYLEISEIRDDINRLDEMSKDGKLEQMAYINAVINTCDLLPAYENLYRTILTFATGIDYNNMLDEDMPYVYYILEGEKIIKDKKGNYKDDSLNLLKVYYNIDDNNAFLLSQLIMNRPDQKRLYEIMKGDSDFGLEDYIVESKQNYGRIIDTYYGVLFSLREANDFDYFINENIKASLKKTK